MRFRVLDAAALAAPFCLLIACTGCAAEKAKDPEPPLFPPNPECTGAAVVPYQGGNDQIISSLTIGESSDGFDLDGDGMPDNKLSAAAGLAKTPIEDSFKKYQILIPMEFFDLTTIAPDTCVKFAVYLGVDPYLADGDGDGATATLATGDCNDHDGAIHPGAAEVAGNRKDDDCNGKADEGAAGVVSADTDDHDGDGQSMHDGDCDDTNPDVKLGLAEICGDGLDNDCDGVADRSQDVDGNATACNPFDDSPDPVALDPRSFDAAGKPAITFVDGVITQTAAGLELDAGPSIFEVTIPVSGNIQLHLKITGATIKALIQPDGAGFQTIKGQLGGVLDARTADTIRGLEVSAIGLTKADSLLDASFANLLGSLLTLPHAQNPKYKSCRTPDIDVDRDGLEIFCDSNPNDDLKTVDLCVDGDGTEVRDEVDAGGVVTKHCTEAVDALGKPRFVDGISVELNFQTRPTMIVRP
jgi:Putative metal-binding motif